MKKIIAVVLVLVTLMLCFSSCGSKDAIKIAPHDLNMPDSYEIEYVVVTNQDGEEYDDIAKVVCGCDADGNFYYSYTTTNKNYSDSNVKKLCIGSEDSYDEYLLNQETGEYELVAKNRRWVDAFVACNEFLEYANDTIDDYADVSYKKINALTDVAAGVSSESVTFSDTERFEYYSVTGGNRMSGKTFEAVVEKETGACIYVNYLEPSLDGTEYYFYATKYTTPHDGDYDSLLHS